MTIRSTMTFSFTDPEEALQGRVATRRWRDSEWPMVAEMFERFADGNAEPPEKIVIHYKSGTVQELYYEDD